MTPSDDEGLREEIDKAIDSLDWGDSSYSRQPTAYEFQEVLLPLISQKIIVTGDTSDGYHTFNELYEYRMLYNAAFFNAERNLGQHKSKRHSDGELCFGGGWFIVMIQLPTGQVSNHYELKDWDLFNIPERERADAWDGHTPQEAARRLREYLTTKQDIKETK